MKTTKRFDNAIKKLYTAFHEGTLNMYYCSKCAVGNILGHHMWHGKSVKAYLLFNKRCADEIIVESNDSGYSAEELARIEYVFILAHEKLHNDKDKNYQFKGLCAVIEYLCELDGIPNVTDYTKLFEEALTKEK